MQPCAVFSSYPCLEVKKMVHTVNCISCGECIRECFPQANAIAKWSGGVKIDLDLCRRCGHCSSVCPTGAMDNPLSPLLEPVKAPLAPELVLQVLRTPRSVRRFKPELVPEDTLRQLLDAGRYPSTGMNSQGISYLVVSGREKVEEIARLYAETARALPESEPLKQAFLRPVIRQEEEHFDALFYGCSQLIFAISRENFFNWQKNALFSLTYIALLAPSLGLGTCWAGQLERLATMDAYRERFARLIGLPEGMKVCACMMVGYPDVKFRRMVERDPLKVYWR